MIIKAQIPKKLEFLFKPARYKVARGGRGSAKSWSFARALLLTGVSRCIRVLCAREIQLSIKQSVHKLLKDQIELLGLESHYNVLETEIRGINGTEFSFTGLSTLTIDTIKSFEGVDICWVEEGQTISAKSWKILIPTIRKMESEIWISYNPDLETDETHIRFTINPPPDCTNVVMNWRDNPFFNQVLDRERLHCLQTDPDSYDNIWEGKCRPAVEGAIYFKQMQMMVDENRICNLPYDPLLKVHVVMDLGGPTMAIGMVQKHLSEIRIIDYIEGGHADLGEYSADLKERRYNWGKLWLPHDGYAKSVQTGMSSYNILKALGWDIPDKKLVNYLSVEEGIKAVRLLFRQIYIDKVRCERLVECLKRYRRHVNKQTGSEASPLHDEFSHGADMLRGLCININRMTNDDSRYVPSTHKELKPRLVA